MGIEVRALAWLRSHETAHDFALRIDLQDASGYGIAHIKDVVWRHDKAKQMSQAPLPQELAISIEDLDACILTVAYIDESPSITIVWGVSNCPGPVPFIPQPSSGLPYLSNFKTREFP